jgi:predicted transcriptional regulator
MTDLALTFAETEGRKPYRYERPLHGVFGSVSYSGERLVCHLCGRDFLALGTHINAKHGVTAFEYKAMFGLMRNTPLMTLRLVHRHHEIAVTHRLGPQNQGTKDRMAAIRPLAIAATRSDPRVERTTHLREVHQQHARNLWRSKPAPSDHCPQGHPWDGFKTMGGSQKGKQRRCRQCNRDWVKRWRQANPEKFKEQRRRWRANHALLKDTT